MDKIILWCCLLLIPVSDGFFIKSRDLRRILSFLPTSSSVTLSEKSRKPFHHRYHQHHNQLSNHIKHHHHHDDGHSDYYNHDNHYHHHHHYDHEIKPEPIKEDFYDDNDYDYYQDRHDDFSNNRRKHYKQKHTTEKQHVDCEHDKNSRQHTKKYKPKSTKPANVVYQKKLQQDYEKNDEDYDQEYSIIDHRNYRKINDNSRRPFTFTQDYVTGVLATIPKIKDTELNPEYFEYVKFNNPFMGAFNDNYGDIGTQTELIREPLNFF